MSEPRTSQIPGCAYDLVHFIDDVGTKKLAQTANGEVAVKLAVALRASVLLERPMVSLMRRVAALRRHDPSMFRRLARWLDTPSVKFAFKERGLKMALSFWTEACKRAGPSSSVPEIFALRSGRSKSMAFTRYQDAGIVALYFVIMREESRQTAVEKASYLPHLRHGKTIAEMKAIPTRYRPLDAGRVRRTLEWAEGIFHTNAQLEGAYATVFDLYNISNRAIYGMHPP